MVSSGSISRGQLRPFFRPIVSVTDGEIFGYEVLARTANADGSTGNLGAFFSDESVSEAERVRVDRMVRELAFERVQPLSDPPRLFINIHPAWIYQMRESAA